MFPAIMMLLMLALTGPAWGQLADQSPSRQLEGIDIVEKLGERVPRNLVFTDSEGQEVQLSEYFEAGKPVVFNLMYFKCPMLCQLSSQGLVDVLGKMDWTPGEEFTVLTVSFAPDEGPELAARYREASISAIDREHAKEGWSFLTGDQANITALTESVGFGYKWVEEKNEYAHAAALIVVTPDGRISRYLHGIHHEPATLRRSLVEASDGQIGTLVDQVLWRCLAYDPDAGEYVVAAWTVLRLGGLLTVIAMAATLGSLWFLDSRRKKTAALP